MAAGVALDTGVLVLKRALLTWINGILHGQSTTNFNTDWKDGRRLSALVDYCKPGLIPDHASLKASNAVQNISHAMELARAQLGISLFMAPEDLAMEKPDEYSLMMYVSQFCGPDSPGQRTLLSWIQQQIPDQEVTGFTLSWVDGKALGALTNAVSGGKFSSYLEMNIEQSMIAAEKMLGIRRIITPDHFSKADLDQLLRLSYISQFYNAKENKDASSMAPAAAEKVEVSDIQIPNKLGDGKAVWVELECSDAGYGEVKAEVKGRNAGSVTAVVKEVEGDDGIGTDKFHVSFVPPSVDVYDFSILYGGGHVIGSPFSVNLYPPDPEKVKHTGTEDSSETGQDVAMSFETKEAGRGKLNAKASGEITGTVPIKIIPLGDGSFTVSFNPPFPDIYTVDVLWGKFTAQAVGENSGPVALQVNQDKKSEYLVSFKPPNPDVYIVDVNWDGKPVPGSPFTIDLLPPPQPEQVECAVPIYNEPGEEAELLVDATAAGSGKLTTRCTGEKTGELPVEVEKIAGRTYQVTFTPPEKDLFTLDVLFDEKHVKGSPFSIDMRPGAVQEFGEIEEEQPKVEAKPDASKCVILDLPRAGMVIPIMKPLHFSINCEDAGPGELKITAEGPAVNKNPPDISVEPRPDETSVFDITFVPKAPSAHAINLLWSDDPIPKSPLKVSAIDPANVAHFPYGKPAGVDFDADCKSSELKVHVVHDETGTSYKSKISKVHKGKYKVTFQPKEPGHYRVHISVKDKEIPESPIIIFYDKPPKPEACKVNGLNSKCYVSEPINFTVDATEAGSGDLSIKHLGPKHKKEKTELTVNDNKDGTYSVDFVPHSIGDHSFAIGWAGKPIPGSPFHTAAVERTPDIITDVYLVENPGQSSQKEEEVPPSDKNLESLVGKPLLLRVTVSDELKKEKLTANAVGKTSGSTDLDISRKSDNIHEILLNPTEPDLYTVTAKVGDKDIPRSPIDIEYTKPTADPTKCKIIGVDKLPSTMYVNKPIDFKVYTENAGPGDLAVTADSPMVDEPLAVEVKQSPVESVYDVSYVPNGPGLHTLNVTWAREPIPDSPIKMNISEPPVYNHGRPVGMDINADCKPGDLEAHAVHVDSNTPYKVKIAKVQKGKYKLTLEPKDPGYYHIHVLMKQNEVPGSPFVIKYGQPAHPEKCIVRDQPGSVYVGIPITFTIDAHEAGSGELNIKASVPKTEFGIKNPDIRVGDNKDGTFSVECIPITAGEHSFDVFWDGEVIPDSPVKVDVKKVEKDEEEKDEEEEEEKQEEEEDKGMDLTDLLDEYITAPKPIEEIVSATPADEVEAGIPLTPIKIERRSNPIIIVVGKALKLKVRPKDQAQRDGKLVAKAQGEETGSGDVKTSQYDDGVFEVYFNPPMPDYYVVDVKLNGENVPQSPFHVLYIPAPVQEPVVHAPVNEQLFATFTPDQPIDYSIDLSQAGDGALSAKCVGESCGDVPVTYEPVSPDSKKYKVAFVPPQPDLYNLSVFFNDKELKDSPYKIDLRKRIEEPVDMLRLEDSVEALPVLEDAEPNEEDGSTVSLPEIDEGAHTIEEVPPEEFTIYIGTPLVVKVHPKTDDQKNGELTGTAVGNSVGPVNVSTFKQPDDTMVVKINPTQPDRYTVDIKLNDESIPRSPFMVNYIMPPTDPTQCKLIGVEDIPDYIEVGTEVDLQVDSKKAGPGDLTVSAAPAVEEDIPSMLSAKKNPNETGMYDITYIPNSQGKHSLDFKWADQSIPKSPVEVLVIDPAKTEMVPYGKPAGVDVDSDSSLRAHCIHKESNQNYKVKTNKLQKGKYRLSFQPKDPGLYFLHAFVKDKEIPQSPYIIRYARPAKPDACKVIGLGDRCFLGETVAFNVDTKEAGDGNLQIKTLGPDGKEKGTCDFKDNKDGTYSAEFTPEVAGMHELQITWAGKPVPGQPFPLFVRDHSKEELLAWLFLVDRLGELHPVEFPQKDHPEIVATTDQALLLRVQARTNEQKKGKFTVTATDTDSDRKYDVDVTKTRNDTFEARFLPTVPQTYNIEALFDTKPIPNTPFTVKYDIAQPDASKCVILGLEKHPDKFQVSKDIFFQVDTRLAGDGKLSLTAEGVQVRPKLEAKASKEDPRIIDIILTPAAPGTHKIKVLWSGEAVPKSPLSFPVEAITRYPYGKPVGLDIDLDAKAGDIDAYVIHKETGARLKVKTTKPSKGKYRFAFQPKKPGLYALHILIKKKEIKESPIYFRYEGPPRPEACIVRDVPEDSYIKEPTSFTVDATEAGSSNLVVKVASPSKGKEGELKILNNEDGTYTVDHTPDVLGEHKFNMTWAGKTIPDSPVCINVKKRVPKAKTCLGPYVNIVSVGEHVGLDIVNLGKHSGSDNYITATARGKIGDDKPTVEDKDGTCKVTFVPTVADDYTLNVKIHEEDVEGSPFYIKSVDKPSLSKDFQHPEGGCHSDVEAGKEVCLVIPKDELLPLGSEPQVEAVGPEGPCTVELIDEVESSYGLNFTPTVPGDYLVHVKKDKEAEDEIDNSPFKVTAIEKQSEALKVHVPESQQNVFVNPIALGTSVDFDINTADAGYGTLKVKQSGPGKANIKLAEKGQGVYACNVVPTERGRCTLEILWNDDGILGCPFTLTFVPIAGVQLEGETFVVGMQNMFTVDRKNVVEGQLEVTCSESQAAEITILPSDDQKAYNCTITAKREGDYRINIKYNGYHIIGSPFNVYFQKPDNTHMSFSLQAEGAETSDVNATVQNSSTLEQLPVQLSDLFGGKYGLEFTPTQGLEYLVTIKCLVKIKSEQKMMIGSPFVLSYERIPADASKCRAEGSGLKDAVAGEWSSFYVYTEGAGTGELKVDITGDVFGDEEATITAITPTKYEVKYILRKQGNYKIIVSWDGQDIPGSPFEINCTSPKVDTSFGEPDFPSEVTFGEPVSFTLTPVHSPTEKQDIQVTARSSTRGTTPGTVTHSDDGSFKCSVEIKYPGKYLVEVTCNGTPIQGTPFVVKVSQPPKPEKVRAAGPGLQDGYIGQEGNFTIDTEEAGSGKLSVNVEGPKGGFKINLDRHPEMERIILARYSPHNVGVYIVSIKWADEDVPGSPFTVNIKSEEDKDLEGN